MAITLAVDSAQKIILEVPDDRDSLDLADLNKQFRALTKLVDHMQRDHIATVARLQKLELDRQTKDDRNNANIPCRKSVEDEGVESTSDKIDSAHISNIKYEENIWEQSHQHQLRSSVWEMAIVVNMGILSYSAMLQFLCAFLLNLFFQIVISAAMMFSFGDDRVDIESIDAWRRTVGHSYREANSVTGQSLLSSICAKDDTLGTYEDYRNMLQGYDRYMACGGIGEWLAVVCVAVWILTVTEDVLSCISFVDGVFSLPTAVRTRLMSSWATVGTLKVVTFEFEALGFQRKLFLMVVSILRLTMVAVLCIPGSVWLSRTHEINELLLNACALGFVFELDDLCFDIIAPLDMRTLSENIKPLPKYMNKRFNTLLLPKIPPLLLGGAFFLYMLFDYIVPTKQYLIDMHVSLCGGNLDFVYGLNVDTKLIYSTPTKSADDAVADSNEAEVLKSLVEAENMTRVTSVLHMDNFASLRSRSELEMVAFTEQRMLRCVDLLHAYPMSVLNAVQRYNANPRATSCEGLKASCFGIGQKLLRLTCPVTCGAASPRSGMFLDRREYGIKREMCKATPTFQAAFAAIPCIDPSPEALMAMPGWGRSWNLMVDYWGRFSLQFRTCYQNVADSFFNRGCDALALYQNSSCMGFASEELCTDFDDVIRLARFCPVACGCLGFRGNHSACPPSCALCGGRLGNTHTGTSTVLGC